MSVIAPQRPAARLASWRAAAACVALAALSLLIPSAPTTDPWGWIIWGHELVYGGFHTVLGGAPTWKPFPVLFTTPLALTGDAAPALWLLVARAGGLYSLVVAYRLGNRLESPAAGLLAAVGLVLSGNWLRALAHGYTEPLAIGLLLAAVDGHLTGHRRRALALGTLTALIRPEALPLVAIYALVLARRSQVRWPLAAALVASVPLLWVVPDWLSSGIFSHGSQVAAKALPGGIGHALHSMLEAVFITPAPLTVCALAAVAVSKGWERRAVRGILALAGGWAAVLAVLLLAGYPPSERFFVLPAALVSVVGAVGAMRLVKMPTGRVLAPALVATLMVALVARGVDAGDAAGDSVRRAKLESELGTAIRQAGPAAILRCGSPRLPGGLTWLKGKVANELDIRPLRVRAARTSAAGYVERLAMSGEEALPARPPRTVRVWLRHRSGVLLLPFGGSAIHMENQRLRLLGAAGRWRVMARADNPRCSGTV